MFFDWLRLVSNMRMKPRHDLWECSQWFLERSVYEFGPTDCFSLSYSSTHPFSSVSKTNSVHLSLLLITVAAWYKCGWLRACYLCLDTKMASLRGVIVTSLIKPQLILCGLLAYWTFVPIGHMSLEKTEANISIQFFVGFDCLVHFGWKILLKMCPWMKSSQHPQD